MEELYLRSPRPEDQDRVLAYKRAFIEAGDHMNGAGGLAKEEAYGKWQLAVTTGNPLPGRAPSSNLLCIRKEDDQMVGIIDLRWDLTEELLRHGGHIGYSIHPGERGKGYAKAMLGLALSLYREKGYQRVLLTCDKANRASARTIMANQGVLQDELQEADGTMHQRYWITL